MLLKHGAYPFITSEFPAPFINELCPDLFLRKKHLELVHISQKRIPISFGGATTFAKTLVAVKVNRKGEALKAAHPFLQ